MKWEANSHAIINISKILNLSFFMLCPLDAYSLLLSDTYSNCLIFIWRMGLQPSYPCREVREGDGRENWVEAGVSSCKPFSHSSTAEKLSFTGSLLSGRAGSDNLQLLARAPVSQISVAWRLPAWSPLHHETAWMLGPGIWQGWASSSTHPSSVLTPILEKVEGEGLGEGMGRFFLLRL